MHGIQAFVTTIKDDHHCKNNSKFDQCWLYQLYDSVSATRNFCYLLHISNGKQLNKLIIFF